MEKRFSKLIYLELSQSHQTRVDFGDGVSSELPGSRGRILFFRMNSPVVSLHWMSGDFELENIPKQFRFPTSYNGKLVAVLFQVSL